MDGYFSATAMATSFLTNRRNLVRNSLVRFELEVILLQKWWKKLTTCKTSVIMDEGKFLRGRYIYFWKLILISNFRTFEVDYVFLDILEINWIKLCLKKSVYNS